MNRYLLNYDPCFMSLTVGLILFALHQILSLLYIYNIQYVSKYCCGTEPTQLDILVYVVRLLPDRVQR